MLDKKCQQTLTDKAKCDCTTPEKRLVHTRPEEKCSKQQAKYTSEMAEVLFLYKNHLWAFKRAKGNQTPETDIATCYSHA